MSPQGDNLVREVWEVLNENSRTLGKLEASISALNYRLIGNGQPGLVPLLEKRMGQAEDDIDKLQEQRFFSVGLAVGLSSIASSAFTALIILHNHIAAWLRELAQ